MLIKSLQESSGAHYGNIYPDFIVGKRDFDEGIIHENNRNYNHSLSKTLGTRMLKKMTTTQISSSNVSWNEIWKRNGKETVQTEAKLLPKVKIAIILTRSMEHVVNASKKQVRTLGTSLSRQRFHSVSCSILLYH